MAGLPGIFNDLRAKPTQIAVGLNSGTSYDGIDAALVEITGAGTQTRLKLLAFENFRFKPVDRQKIKELFSHIPYTQFFY